MNIIYLSSYDLFIAFSLIILLGLISFKNKLEIHRPLFIASIRATIQLSLVGLVLNFVFTGNNFYFVAGIWLIMLSAAGYEVMSRQKFKEKGIRRYSTGTFSMFISSFSVLLLTLAVILNAEPWYSPRYAIPILGMLLGNTMNGIALGMNTFSNLIKNNRAIIEQRLSLGETADESIKDFLTESFKTGMIPIINSMAASGLVSLPGMMTGQILAGNNASDAVKYQILILFLISAGTGFGILVSLKLMKKRIFDSRDRYRMKDNFDI